MFQKLVQFWQLKDLRRRVLITLGLLLLERLLIFIPLPLIRTSALREFFNQNDLLGFLNIFSGGGLQNFSIITMGVGPYITASIVMQLLTIVIPSLEELQKEGEYGQRKINQYSRLLTVPIGIVQGYSVLALLRQNQVIATWTPIDLVGTLVMMAAGTLFVMWLGEIITESGVGNGISLIITVGILGSLSSRLQSLISTAQTSGSYTSIIAVFAVVLLTIIFVILINEGKREVPVAYARRIRAGGGFGSVPSSLPIKINAAGVVPIIFAVALLTVPAFLGQFLSHAKSHWLSQFAHFLNTTFQPSHLVYNLTYFFLIFIFTYFYTYIIFKPDKVAENLQKQGGYIPGVRPGKDTENYVRTIINRITLFGAIFLAIVAVAPAILQTKFPSQSLLLSGTSVLIVIAVILETARQIQSQYLMRTYDAYSE